MKFILVDRSFTNEPEFEWVNVRFVTRIKPKDGPDGQTYALYAAGGFLGRLVNIAELDDLLG